MEIPAANGLGKGFAFPPGGRFGRIAGDGGAEIDAAGKLFAVEGSNKTVVALQYIPAGRESDGNAAGRFGDTIRGGEYFKVLQHRADVAQIQQLINIGIVCGVLCLQANLHTVPGANQCLAVIQNHIHSRCILPVFRIQPAGQNIICPDTCREAAQLGRHILRPILLDAVSGIDHGCRDKAQQITTVFIRLEPDLPDAIITGYQNAGIVVRAGFLFGGDTIRQI